MEAVQYWAVFQRERLSLPEITMQAEVQLAYETGGQPWGQGGGEGAGSEVEIEQDGWSIFWDHGRAGQSTATPERAVLPSPASSLPASKKVENNPQFRALETGIFWLSASFPSLHVSAQGFHIISHKGETTAYRWKILIWLW